MSLAERMVASASSHSAVIIVNDRADITRLSGAAGVHVGQDDLTVGDLFELIRLTMPDDDPGSLPREQYADLVAYILAVNKFPTGPSEIGIDAGLLKQIRILATKP